MGMQRGSGAVSVPGQDRLLGAETMLGCCCTPDQLPALCRPSCLQVRVIKSQVTPATSAATAANAGSIQLWGRRDFISKPCRGDPDADGRPSRTSQTGGAFVAGWTNCSP
jgi:hypothetical protein